MLVTTRGHGAGRWVWGRFLQTRESNGEDFLSNNELLTLAGIEHSHEPGIGEVTLLRVTVYEPPRKFSVHVSTYTVKRLFRRFTEGNMADTSTHLPLRTTSLRQYRLGLFLSCLRGLVVERSRDLRRADVSTMYSVTPSFYELSQVLCCATCELFADSINESGVMKTYCSNRSHDKQFGAIGSWEECNNYISGAAGNPPFSSDFIGTIMSAFDRAVVKQVPFCRLLLLPWGSSYGVKVKCERGQGAVLVTIPPQNLGMKAQSAFFEKNQDTFFPQPLRKQGLHICLWVNPEYWLVNPPPADVEDVIWAWVTHSCRSPEEVRVHESTIASIFPVSMRSHHEAADHFVANLSIDN